MAEAMGVLEGCRRVVVCLGHVDAGHPTPFGWYVALQWLDDQALPLGTALHSRQRRRSSFRLKTAVAMPWEPAARFLQLRVMKRHKLHRDEPVAEHLVPLPADLSLLHAPSALHEAPSLAAYVARYQRAPGRLRLPRIASRQRKGERARKQTVRKAHSAASLAAIAPSAALGLDSDSAPSLLRSQGALSVSVSGSDGGCGDSGDGGDDTLEMGLDGDWLMVEASGGGGGGGEEEEEEPVEVEFGMRVEELLHAPPVAAFRWLAVHEKPGWLLRRGTLFVDVCVSVAPKALRRFSVQAALSTQRLPWQNVLPQGAEDMAQLAECRIRLAFALLQGELPDAVQLKFKCELAKGGHIIKQQRTLQLDWEGAQGVGVSGLWRCVGRLQGEELPAATVSCHALAEVNSVADWDQLKLLPGHDLSAKFDKEVEAVQAMSAKELLASTPGLGDTAFVLVGGLFTEYYPGYFAPNRAALTSLQAEFVVAPIRTECGCMFNAPLIAETIEEVAKQGKRVVLISHSKGGTDIHAAVALFPKLRELVHGAILFQPVFGGTIGVEDSVSKVLNEANVRILKGERQALNDLSYASRFMFVREHEFPTADIPTLCLSSYVSAKEETSSVFGKLVDKAMQLTSSLTMSRTHFRSDGLVVRSDARVPGAYEILVENMAHGAPAFEVPGARYQADTIMLACIRLLLAVLAEQD